MALVKATMAADSISAWRRCRSGLYSGYRRAVSLRTRLGIIWKVDELPTPVKKNSAMKPAKNRVNDVFCSPQITTSTDRIMPMKDRKSTRLNSSHVAISYAVICLKKKQEPDVKKE